MTENNVDDQFHKKYEYYLKQLDFLNWYRYYFIVQDALAFSPARILEVGTGSGIVKNCLKPHVATYTSFDINPKLKPDIIGDVRVFRPELKDGFDCAIIADVLEHIPFTDLEMSLKNISLYLVDGGSVIITIPHRRSNFLFMTPTYKPHVITVPTGFLSPGAFYRRFIKRKIWIDPDHCWEIGDGKIKRRDVETEFIKAGFSIDKFQKLLYVDYWVLKKTEQISK